MVHLTNSQAVPINSSTVSFLITVLVILNSTVLHFRERMSRLLLPFADQHVEIPSLTAGNIALCVGLKQVGLLERIPVLDFLLTFI